MRVTRLDTPDTRASFDLHAGLDGTGVGLSVTYGLVKEIGGTISVTSQVGKGTTFEVNIPLVMPNKSAE